MRQHSICSIGPVGSFRLYFKLFQIGLRYFAKRIRCANTINSQIRLFYDAAGAIALLNAKTALQFESSGFGGSSRL
jgi:hypothetical protein